MAQRTSRYYLNDRVEVAIFLIFENCCCILLKNRCRRGCEIAIAIIQDIAFDVLLGMLGLDMYNVMIEGSFRYAHHDILHISSLKKGLIPSKLVSFYSGRLNLFLSYFTLPIFRAEHIKNA